MLVYGSTPSGGVILKYTAADGSLQVVTGKNGADVQKAKAANDARIASNSSSSSSSLSNVALNSRKRIIVNAIKQAATKTSSVNNNINNFNRVVVRGSSGDTSTGTYYDIDAALADVKSKAAAYGINLTIPTTYGKSVTSASAAQGIIDSYVSKANAMIAAKYNSASQANQASQQSNAAISAKNVTAAAAAKNSSYYDVDTALASVYAQAKKAGISVDAPKKYGSTVTDAKKAQGLIDDYTASVNKKISATATKNAATSGKAVTKSAATPSKVVAKSSAATSKLTTTYDISASVKSLASTAKQYGIKAPSKTSYSTQAEAQKALDSYTASINAAINAKATSAKNNATAVANSKTYSNTNKYGMTQDQWNRYQKEMTGLPSWQREGAVYWLWANNLNGTGGGIPPYDAGYDGSSWTPTEVAVDSAKLRLAQQAASDAADSARAASAAVQREQNAAAVALKVQAENAANEKKGVVSHAKNSASNASNTKGSNYSKGVVSTGTVASVKPTTAKVVSAGTAKLVSNVKATTQATKVASSKVTPAKATSATLAKLSKQVQTTHASLIKASDSLIRTADIEKHGASNPNSKTAKTIYSSSAVEKTENAAEYKKLITAGKVTTQAKASGATSKSSGRAATANAGYSKAVADAETAKKEYAAVQTAFKPLFNSSGIGINQITDKKGAATVSRNTAGKEVTISSKVKVNGVQKVYTRGGSQTADDANANAFGFAKKVNVVSVNPKTGAVNFNAEKKSFKDFKVLKAEDLLSPVKSQNSKTGVHDAEWDREVALNDKQQKSSNPIISTLAKLDRLVSEKTMPAASLAMIGAKMGSGEQVSEADKNLLRQKTGIGTTQTHSETINNISKKYGNSIIATSAAKAIADKLKSVEDIVANAAKSATPAPVRNEIGKVSNFYKGYSGDNVLAKWGGNVVRSVESANTVLPDMIISANELPSVGVAALKELETLNRNKGYILPTLAYGAAATTAGTIKSAYEDPVKTAAEFYVQGKALEGTAKTLKAVAKETGLATGLTRGSLHVVESAKNPDIIPLKTKGDIVETLLTQEKVSGARAQDRPVGKLLSKNDPALLIRKPIAEGEEHASLETAFMTLKTGDINSVSDYFLNKGGKSKISQRVYELDDIQTVKLPETLKTSIRQSITEKGEFKNLYKSIEDHAQVQATRTGQPVAIPTPKAASGFLEQENEVSLVFPKNANRTKIRLDDGKIASAYKTGNQSFAGFTRGGVIVKKLSFGDSKVPSAIKNIKSNLGHNYDVSVDRYGLYNKADQQAVLINALRREEELYGNALHFEGSFDFGKHGVEHTNNVVTNLQNLKRTHSIITDSEYLKNLGKYHDITKIGASDLTYGGEHAISGARAIRSGQLKGLSSLTQKELNKLADDIAKHTDIKPLTTSAITSKIKARNITHPIKTTKAMLGDFSEGVKTSAVRRPSTEAKMLANADRADLTRFGWKVDESKMFKFGEDRAVARISNTLDSLDANFKRLAIDERAEMSFGRRLTNEIEKPAGSVAEIKSQYDLKSASESAYANILKRQESLAKYAAADSTYQLRSAGAVNAKGYYSNTDALKTKYGLTSSKSSYLGARSGYKNAAVESSYQKVSDYRNTKTDSYRNVKISGYRKPSEYRKTKAAYTAKPYEENYKVKQNYSTGKAAYKTGGEYTSPAAQAGKYNPTRDKYKNIIGEYNTLVKSYANMVPPTITGGVNGYSGSSGGEKAGNIALLRMKRKGKKTPVKTAKKKIKMPSDTKAREIAKLHRTIYNRLGSLNTMLG